MKLIFDGITDSGGITITDTFRSKSFCYAQVLDSLDDYEIDGFLQIVTPVGNRLVPTPKFEINTRDILVIPKAIQDTDLDCYFALLTDYSIQLKMWVVEGDLNAKRPIKYSKFLAASSIVSITGKNIIINNILTFPSPASYLIEILDDNNTIYFSGNGQFPCAVPKNHTFKVTNIDVVPYDIFIYAVYCSEIEEINL